MKIDTTTPEGFTAHLKSLTLIQLIKFVDDATFWVAYEPKIQPRLDEAAALKAARIESEIEILTKVVS